MVDVKNSLIELIGNTPLVRLRRVSPGHLQGPAQGNGLGHGYGHGGPGRGFESGREAEHGSPEQSDGSGTEPQVLAKLEYLNPGGSVKDRIAMRMIDAAESSGALLPGGTIVEPTSGNTGVGLALVAQERGYRCVFVCPDKVASDKINVLRAYGAEVVVCPTAVAPDHPESYYSVSDRLAAEIPGAWKPDQYANPGNPQSHYESTGPEIWAQTDGRVTHFVAGIGTGGTITGAGRYLKEVSGGRVQVIGADPEGSVYSGGTGRPYLVEGVGEDIWPQTYDRDICDRVIAVSDRDSFVLTRRLAREEGLLVGGSSGMAVAAALRVAAEAAPDSVIVVLLPDGGRGYLSKIFNDEWISQHGFGDDRSTAEAKVGDVLARKTEAQSGGIPSFVHMHPAETVAEAVKVLREFGVSQMPVVSPGAGHPDVMAGEVIGAVEERVLLHALYADQALSDDPLEKHMSPPLPMVGSGESVARMMSALEGRDAAAVLVDGKPTGIVTRQDLLAFLANG